MINSLPIITVQIFAVISIMLSRPMEKVLGHFLWGAGPMLGSVHKLREGEGMGDLRGEELKMFYIKKGGGGT